MKKRRLVIVTNHPDQVGGVRVFVETIARGLAKFSDMRVTVASICKADKSTYDDFPDDIESVCFSSYHIPPRRRASGELGHLRPKYIKYEKRRRQIEEKAHSNIRKFYGSLSSDDIVIFTQLYSCQEFIRAGCDIKRNLADRPFLIGQYHNSAHGAVESGDILRIQQYYSLMDRFLCLTPEDALEFAALGITDPGYVYNPIRELTHHTSTPREKVIVSMGRFSDQKTVGLLVQAWAKISHKHRGWILELYGEGEHEREIKSLVANSNIDKSQVKFCGVTSDVGHVFSRASVNIMSSQFEGFPLVISEAGYCGVPTVTFNTSYGVAAQVIDGKTGFLCEQNDIDSLASNLDKLISSSSLLDSMSVNAKKSSQRFLAESIVEDWNAEFKRLRY